MRRCRIGFIVCFVLCPIVAQASFRADELECEQAISWLKKCCPEQDFHEVSCALQPGCNQNTYPALLVEESLCIEDKSCATIRANKTCERVLARKAGIIGIDGGNRATTPTDTVCR